MVVMVGLPESHNAGRLVGYCISQASPASVTTLVSFFTTNVAGYTKKTTVAAISFIAYW
jgi:ACS family allantoate permease-like MFS transporter